MHVWVIAYVAVSIRQMAMALQIDYNKPITVIQKQIESLRALRLRVIRWALLTGQPRFQLRHRQLMPCRRGFTVSISCVAGPGWCP